MMTVVNRIVESLCKPLDSEVRQIIFQNIEYMMRSIKYLREKNDQNLILAQQNGWDLSKLEALVSVIAFYQTVIGPLKGSSRGYSSKTWGSTDIAYGSKICFNKEISDELRDLVSGFENIVGNLGINFWWLQTSDAKDLVYKLGHINKDEESTF